jgi:hypothetical protein
MQRASEYQLSLYPFSSSSLRSSNSTAIVIISALVLAHSGEEKKVNIGGNIDASDMHGTHTDG